MSDATGSTTELQLTAPGGTITPGGASVVEFAAPTGTLTIDMGIGASNTLTLSNLDQRLASGLTVQSEGPDTTVNVDANLATQGNPISISADTITVSGVTLNTTFAAGSSGSIALTGKTITVNDGAVLQAGTMAATAGAVTITAQDLNDSTAVLPIAFSDKDVSVDLDSATIDGGVIDVTAKSADGLSTNPVPGYVQDFVGVLPKILSLISLPLPGGGSLTDLFPGMDASVLIRGADAHVTANNATINGTGAVTLASDTAVNSTGVAIATSNSRGTSVFNAAVGVGTADSTVDTTISGTTAINAGGDINITAVGDVETSIKATALSNNQGATNSNASTLTISVGYTNLTDAVTVGNAATIDSTGGSVSVLATGTESDTASATSTVYVQGRGGISIGVGYDAATVTATVDGKISAAGTINQANSFNGGSATSINSQTGTFFVPNNGYTTGEKVVYQAEGGTPIGGLTDGQTYYVLAQDSSHFQLSNAPPLSLDNTQANPLSTQTLTPSASTLFLLDAIDFDQCDLSAGQRFSERRYRNLHHQRRAHSRADQQYRVHRSGGGRQSFPTVARRQCCSDRASFRRHDQLQRQRHHRVRDAR